MLAVRRASDKMGAAAEAAARELLHQIDHGNMRGVQKALASGAPADGIPGTDLHPLVRAAYNGRLDMISLLLKDGANLETAASRDLRNDDGELVYPRGTHPVHAAAYCGRIEALRALLRAGARPNAKDCYGWTPLMAACDVYPYLAQPRAMMIKVLLDAGALPSMVNDYGCVPLTIAATRGADDAVEVLAAAAPDTVNHVDRKRLTPLSSAATQGHERTVRLLLSAGASDKEARAEKRRSSLELAATAGHDGVVAALLDSGLAAVGGSEAVGHAMKAAIKAGHPRILDVLLGVEGEEMRAHRANSSVHTSSDPDGGCPLLSLATAGCCLAATSVLLAAGADERVFEAIGIPASRIVGRVLESDKRDEAKDAGLVRMLQRGPAFRARSYCWPVQASDAVGVAAVVTVSSGRQARLRVPLGVRVFRPSRCNFFTSRIAR